MRKERKPGAFKANFAFNILVNGLGNLLVDRFWNKKRNDKQKRYQRGNTDAQNFKKLLQDGKI